MTDILDVLGGVGAVNDGAAIKAPCRVATTANLSALYGLLTVDGLTLAADDRVLVKDQTTASENGIWIVQSGAWARAPDFAVSHGVVFGTVVFVIQGTINGLHSFYVSTASPVIGSAMAFSAFGAGTGYTAANIAGDTFTGPVNINSNAALTGQMKLNHAAGLGYAYGAGFGGLWQVQPITGTAAAGVNANLFNITSDNAQITGANFLTGWTFQHTIDGDIQGGRNSLYVLQQKTGATTANGNRNYAAAQFDNHATAGDGGGAGTEQGAYFGLGAFTRIGSGVTYGYNATGAEFNVAVEGSTGVKYKTGLQIVGHYLDRYGATGEESMLLFGQQVDGTGLQPKWANAIRVSNINGTFPLQAGGQILSTSAGTVANGINLNALTITGSAFVSPGVNIGGDGYITGVGFKVGINSVVGARDTGWAAMTGTPDKATAFATSTVTLAQLAGRVMSLQAALTTHGLIGT